MRCNTPMIRMELKSKSGKPFKNNPITKINALRRTTWMTSDRREMPRAMREANDSVMETPTMKRKKGKIRSVGVQPFHSACSSGG